MHYAQTRAEVTTKLQMTTRTRMGGGKDDLMGKDGTGQEAKMETRTAERNRMKTTTIGDE